MCPCGYVQRHASHSTLQGFKKGLKAEHIALADARLATAEFFDIWQIRNEWGQNEKYARIQITGTAVALKLSTAPAWQRRALRGA